MIRNSRVLAIALSVCAVWGMFYLLRKTEEGVTIVSSSGGQEETATIRGNLAEWYTVDYPSDWYIYRNVGGRTIRSISESTGVTSTTHWTKLVFYDGDAVSDVTDGTWSTGTTTKTLTLTRGEAIRYTRAPVTSTYPGVSGVFTDSMALIDVRPHDGVSGVNDGREGFSVAQYIMNAPSSQALVSATLEVDNIIKSIDFLDDSTSAIDWTWYEDSSPTVSTLDAVEVEHPVGWSVTDDSSSIYIGSTSSVTYSDSVWITVTPGVDWSVWSDAELPLRGVSVRSGTNPPVTANGQTTTEYLLGVGRQEPLLVQATVPDTTFGTSQHWLYEQTVWRIMLGTYAWYSSTSGYP